MELFDQLLIKVKWLVFDNFVFSRDKFGYHEGKSSDEWKLNDCIGNVEGSVGEGNGHFWSQI